MAIDKAIDSTQLDADLTSVADAIRTKGGTSAALAFPHGFVDAVEAIETGGGDGDWTTDGIADGSDPHGDFVVTAATLTPYAFSNKTNIGKVTFQNATAMKEGLFLSSAFDELTFPVLTEYRGINAFQRSTGNRVNFGALTTTQNWCYWFRDSNVRIIDFPATFGNIGMAVFAGGCGTTIIILRRTSDVVVLNANNVIFTNQSVAEALTVYVPSALISQYQTATNWSTAYGYNANLFQPLEGSEYE